MTEESFEYTKPVFGGKMPEYLDQQFTYDLDTLSRAEAALWRRDQNIENVTPKHHYHAVCYNELPGPLAAIPRERLFTFASSFSMSFLLSQVMHAHFSDAHHEFQERFNPPFVGLTLGACNTMPSWWLLEHSRGIWRGEEKPVPFEVVADGFLEWHRGQFADLFLSPEWSDVLGAMLHDPDVASGPYGRRFIRVVGHHAQQRYDRPPLSVSIPRPPTAEEIAEGAVGDVCDIISTRDAAERGLV